MAHWGWYWKVKRKHVARMLCSKLPSIDSFKFYKSNLNFDTVLGFTVYPLEVRADAYPDHLKIVYRNRKDYSYIIAVEKLPCNYGSYYYFFKCPLCQKRMRLLYFAGQSIFLCRKCLNLSYQSQCLRPTKRYEHMSEKINSSIKNKSGSLDLYRKPPRMHKNTFEQIKEKYIDYECMAEDASNKELKEWYGEKVELFLSNF